MAFIQWDGKYSVGVRELDEQHKKLVEMINRLHEAMAQRSGQAALAAIFGDLVNYTAVHFSDEEKLMAAHAYPGAATQVIEHKALVKQVKDLQAKYQQGDAAVTIDVLTFLRTWLTHHIMETDRKYGPFFNGKGIR